MELKDDEGNLTGHLVGLFHRTIQFMENGIKPIWVFDGKPPELKCKELDKRKEMKEKAEEAKEEAMAAGDMETAMKMAGRSIKITAEMTADAKLLCKLLGAPMIEAPCEAEAQCAVMVSSGLAFATATEDMDALTFGTNYLLRGFNSKKEPVTQICLKEILEGFDMTMTEFIDLCIMCGCDYSHNIGGIGPVKALNLIKEEKTIENVLEKIKDHNEDETKKKKYIVPEKFLYEESRDLFVNPDVNSDMDKIKESLKWNKPDEAKLKEFLVEHKGFTE